MTIHHLCITCLPAYRGSRKQKKLGTKIQRLDLSLANFLLWRASPQKLYHQDFWEVDQLLQWRVS